MKNLNFIAHATSSAFSLALSRPMIEVLLFEYSCTRVEGDERLAKLRDCWHASHSLRMGPYNALVRRGLVVWKEDAAGETHGPFITVEGSMVAELLIHAGFGEVPG